MRVTALTILSLVSGAFAGNCGPQNGNAKCAATECCSQYGWCGTTSDHCDAASCLQSFSGSSSSCKPAATTDAATGGNCGPQYGNAKCSANECCSQYGWCGTTKDHCDAATCLKPFSGASSQCKPATAATATTLKTSATKQATSPATTFPSSVPVIDVCGHAQGGVTCPGAGANGYFYRCCSSAGHCGPKNDIQDQALYCGDGCQAGYGKCDSETAPPVPTQQPGESAEGETCGPIVNKKCKTGLCCSGSNFCGTGVDFCGAANWCQSKWGQCS